MFLCIPFLFDIMFFRIYICYWFFLFAGGAEQCMEYFYYSEENASNRVWNDVRCDKPRYILCQFL